MTAGPGSALPAAGTNEVIGLYRACLAGLGRLGTWPLDGFDRTGVPVVATVWTDREDPAVQAHGVGYGADSAAAEIGALGELAERVVMAQMLRARPVHRGSYRELVRRHGTDAVADPLTLVLPAGSAYHPDQQLVWLPAVRWRTGQEVLVPQEWAASDPGALTPGTEPLVLPITNGLGAGDTAERAVAHGLLELLQRDGDTVDFRALDSGVVVDLDGLTDPVALAVLDRLRSVGIEPVVKVASTEFVPVVYAAGHDPDPAAAPLAASAMGEAAHPDGQAAVAKALLEYASSRARRAFAFGPLEDVGRLLPDYLDLELDLPVGAQEERALEAMRAWVALPPDELRRVVEPTLLGRTRTVSVADLPAAPAAVTADPGALLGFLLDLLADFDVLVVHGAWHGVHAAKVVVPGLEVETLSYLRIGERVARRLLDRGSDLVGRGPADGVDRLPVRLTEAATARLGGPVWLDRRRVDEVVGPLYPLYREPRRHAVQRTAAGRSNITASGRPR
ncbi:YcaO-like family protein [Nakamurella endophytica]|uniref:YcaO domain-containing protein n=1 Tax=Nakamurella endophytica TaxID=1748367 RepID=A0A917T3M3_9ACTN|nr:YcaO-like family protein [Nakamurella endophytica]GGM07110.1 hypothetical protein GCM10011594_28900 [Nakamurella endophytica]